MFRTLALLGLLVLPVTTLAKEAGPAPGGTGGTELLAFRGRLYSADATGFGDITVDGDVIEVEVQRVFSKESHSFALEDVKALHLKRGLSHSWVLMDLQSGESVRIRTQPGRYDELKQALKGRITRG
jgi:hypothetical protein